jgi:hypothetical protein
MFKIYELTVKVLIEDGHGWRTYDDAKIAGNYATVQARIFWHSLILNGFTTDYEI